jgi:Transposase DDE domain
MLLEPIFERFTRRSPFAVMSRAILERALCSQDLDQLFERRADQQYTRELLFSSVVDLMSVVVTCTYGSVRAAYVDEVVDISVSLTSVYNKLQGIEDSVSAELVRHTAARLRPVIEQLGGVRPEIIPGYQMRVLDGNHLAATEHRLKETRHDSAAPLPGQSLVVYEPAVQMATDIILCQDGHAQERSLLDLVLDKIRARDLWLADRNFCVKWFLLAIAKAGGFFLIREHEQLNYCKAGKLRRRGRVETGQVLEQSICLKDDEDGKQYWVRRVVLQLDEATRDGDVEMALISNLPDEVTAETVADTYRKRWTIETGFAELTATLACEIDTLCYPKAALFVFCVALAAYNVQSAIKGVMRAVHPTKKVDEDFSRYFMAKEITRVDGGMMIAFPPDEWRVFRDMPTQEFTAFLRRVAQQVNFDRYPKSHRGPKKAKAKRRYNKKRPHVSTARLLDARKANKCRGTK